MQYAAAGEEKNGQIEGTSREQSDEQGRTRSRSSGCRRKVAEAVEIGGAETRDAESTKAGEGAGEGDE